MNSINLSQSETASATELVESYRLDISRKLVPKKRSEMGQFLTSVPIARFMASLFDSVGYSQIRLLDAGAGVGSLTAAFVEEFCSRTTHPQEIYIKAVRIRADDD
jgi:adenine-specific DNA-methyltransferase